MATMRACLIASIGLVFWGLNAFAASFDAPAVFGAYYEARAACRLGEWHDKQMSNAESQEFCLIRDALGAQLQAEGYCWNSNEQVWIACKKD